jgi:hypothetical protein
MLPCLYLSVSLALAANPADDFLWLIPRDKDSSVQVILSDSLKPRILPKIEKATVFLRDEAGKTGALKCKEGDDHKSLVADIPGKGIRWIGAECTRGVFEPDGQKPYLLRCYGSALIGYTPHLDATTDAPRAVSTPWKQFPLEVVVNEKVALILRVYWQGKPAADPDVMYRAWNWKGWAHMHVSKETPGMVYDQVPQGNAGMFAVRVTHIEAREGEHEGKKYQEVHHHATLVLRVVDSDRR